VDLGTVPIGDAAHAEGGVAELAAALESIESRLAGQTSELVRLRRANELNQALLDLHVACTRQRSIAGTARQIGAVASAMLRSPVVAVSAFEPTRLKPHVGVAIGDGLVNEEHLATVATQLVGDAEFAWMRTENRLAVLSLEGCGPSGATLLAELHAERALLVPLYGQGEFVGCIAAKLPKSASVVDDMGLFEAAASLQGHAGDLLHLALVLDELRRRALHDAVTGLPNLAVFEQRLVRALARRAAHQDGHREVAVILLQVLGVGRITDTHGATGVQAVLREIASRLLEIAPEHDLGHLGASHFALIAHGEPGAGIDLARTASEAVETPLVLPFGTVEVRCHLGVAVARDADTAGHVIRRAETAARIARTTDEHIVVDE